MEPLYRIGIAISLCALHDTSIISSRGGASASPPLLWLSEVDRRTGVQHRGSLSGVVVDTAGKAVADAEVGIEALNLRTRSDESGRFLLISVPAGTHLVTARAIGYSSATLTLQFNASGEVSRQFTLRRSIAKLDSVDVRATRTDSRLLEFEEHRRVGLGRFLTRDDLEKQRNQSMANILAPLTGVGIVRGMGNRGWLLSRRALPSSNVYVPDRPEIAQGMKRACYAQVYVNDHIENAGIPTTPFDVNTFAPDQIEAIEWYAGPSQTPSRYARLNSSCGVLVIHTRRPPS